MLRCLTFAPCTTLILVFLGYIPYCPSTHAQDFRPFPTFGPYSSFIENKALFIASGKAASGSLPVTQAFTIDLSVSWNTSNPKFKPLPDAPAYESSASAISSDGNQWVVCYDGNCHAYSTEAETWTKIISATGGMGGTTATADPESGLIYVPQSVEGDMMIVNASANSYTRMFMAPPLQVADSFSVAWSRPSRKLFLFGGNTGSYGQIDRFNAFSYSEATQWDDLRGLMKGDVPTPRKEACLVSAYGGTKMILFGGFTYDRTSVLRDIYVLEVATMTWTKGIDVSKEDQRGIAACGVSNDHFIAWGGGTDRVSGSTKNFVQVNSTIVYNLKTNNWTSTYICASPTSLDAPSGTDPSPSDKSSRVINIAVAVLGVAIMTLVIWALRLYRTYRKRAQSNIQHPASKPRDPGYKPRDPSSIPCSPVALISMDSLGRNPQELPEVEDGALTSQHQWTFQQPAEVRLHPHALLPGSVYGSPSPSPTYAADIPTYQGRAYSDSASKITTLKFMRINTKDDASSSRS